MQISQPKKTNDNDYTAMSRSVESIETENSKADILQKKIEVLEQKFEHWETQRTCKFEDKMFSKPRDSFND